MASMQCYRSCHETCQTKCPENSSFGHKLTEIFKGSQPHHNNQPHCGQNHNHQAHCYAQTHNTQPHCYGQTQKPSHSDLHHSKTQSAHCATNTHSSHGHHGMVGHTQSHGHGVQHSSSSHGVASSCHGKTHEKKMMMMKKNKCGKKEKSHCKTKNRDGNRSCSSDSSGSDSD